MIADVRALLFLVFQAVVTPVYAAVFLLFCWLPRIPRYLIARHWCRVNLLVARWICGIRWRVIGRRVLRAGDVYPGPLPGASAELQTCLEATDTSPVQIVDYSG